MSIPFIQLSNLSDVSIQFTVIDTPVWRAKLWVNPYTKKLPFMADKDNAYNNYSIALGDVVIDFIEYLRVYDYGILRNVDKSWMLDPQDSSKLLIHFEHHSPPYTFLSLKSGKLIGFSYNKALQLGELKTYPLLLDFPNIEDKADNFQYQKMQFASGTIAIDNSAGMLDDLFELFGNDLNLLLYNKDDTLNIVRTFFIESYLLGLKQTRFSVKDKRSKLTFQAPNTFYTKMNYPFIEDSLIDKIIQDAYGKCRGVAGTCIMRNKIYNNKTPESGFNDWFEFKFARTITAVDEVWVNMSDTWTQVFPGLGVPANDNYKPANEHPIKTVTKDIYGNDVYIDITEANKGLLPENDGRLAIWWSQALKDNPGHLYRRNGNPNKVKMNGIFVNKNTPGDIIKDLLVYYGEMPYEESYLNMAEWNKEMANGSQIGLCLNSQSDIFNWIEKIQNGSVLGFQMIMHKNLFSARVDNPNRQETFDIKWFEILNTDSLESELNGSNYATYTKINYDQEYSEKEYKTIVDQSQRLNILDVYKYEKEYENDTFLVNEADVIKKGKIILENFMQVRPIIRGIKLNGFHWEDIQLFSTGWIDFSLELPRNMKPIQQYMKKRNFIGKLRVKIISCTRDLKLEQITIDVIQCDKLEAIND